MQFRNWSELMQNDTWASFALAWKGNIRQWPEAAAHGFINEFETEALLLSVINKCIEKGIRKIAFDQFSPDLISTDGETWATINPAFANASQKPPYLKN